MKSQKMRVNIVSESQPDQAAEKRRIELAFFKKARRIGVPIPFGEKHDDNPDFQFLRRSPALGIEVTAVVRPATSNGGICPVQHEAFHREIVKLAKQRCGLPVRVTLGFSDAKGQRQDKKTMVKALADFVTANAHLAKPFVGFQARQTPEGFDWIGIASDDSDHAWWNNEVGGITYQEIKPQVDERIKVKDEKLKLYRKNLPAGAHVWLLLYSGIGIADGVPIPFDAADWKIPCGFERVFWYSQLDGGFVEINAH